MRVYTVINRATKEVSNYGSIAAISDNEAVSEGTLYKAFSDRKREEWSNARFRIVKTRLIKRKRQNK